MNKKAVKIDLSTFFDDERKMTCVLVDPNWKSVECLQKRIEYLFGVETVRFLSDGYFLPPQESIEIVKFCSDLKAFVPKDALEKRKKKKTKKSKTIEKSSEQESSSNESTRSKAIVEDDDSQKKRKFSYQASKSLTSQAKRSRSCNPLVTEITSTSEQVAVNDELLTSAKESDDELKNKKSKSKKSKSSIITSNFVEEPMEVAESQETVSENITNIEENTLIARDSEQEVRKRHTSTPKEKKISEIGEEKTFNDEMKSTAARPSSIPSSTFLNESKMLQQQNNAEQQNTNSSNPNNPFKKPRSSNRAHIYFNDSGEMVSNSKKSNKKSFTTKEKEAKTIVIFRCPLNEITNGSEKPRIFNLKSKIETNNQNKKQVVEIQEDIMLPTVLMKNSLNSSNRKEKSLIKEKLQLEQISPTIKSPLRNEPNSNQPKIVNSANAISTESFFPSKEQPAKADLAPTNETTNVAEETNSSNEKSSDTSIATDNTTIAKNNTAESNLEITQNEDETKHQDESEMQLTTANESSIMSVDCVDLSIDLDEDEKYDKDKNKTTLTKSKNITEKHDLTRDDDDEEDELTSSSDVEEISEIIDLNETEDNCEESLNNSTLQSPNLKTINVHKILPFSTDLTDLPAIGDIIIFKIRYVNKKQQSVVSDYIAGKAEYINKRTKNIKIFVMDGVKEVNNLPNQYLSNLDESQDCFKYINIKLNEMIEPKLFSSG